MVGVLLQAFFKSISKQASSITRRIITNVTNISINAKYIKIRESRSKNRPQDLVKFAQRV